MLSPKPLYTDQEACMWMRQLAEGIAYLHACKPVVQLLPHIRRWLQQLLGHAHRATLAPIKDDATALLRC